MGCEGGRRTVGHEAEDDDGEERLDGSRAEDDFVEVDHFDVSFLQYSRVRNRVRSSVVQYPRDSKLSQAVLSA